MAEIKRSADAPPFQIIPNWVLHHPQLDVGAIVLYLVVRQHVARGDIHPSRKDLAVEVGYTVTTVDKWRAQLEEAGALVLKDRWGPGGARIESEWIPLWTAPPVPHRPCHVNLAPGYMCAECGSYNPNVETSDALVQG